MNVNPTQNIQELLLLNIFNHFQDLFPLKIPFLQLLLLGESYVVANVEVDQNLSTQIEEPP